MECDFKSLMFSESLIDIIVHVLDKPITSDHQVKQNLTQYLVER